MVLTKTVIQATRYKVKDGMKLSIVEKENGQIVLQNDNETEKLDIGVQKKYYWKDHEKKHNSGQDLKEKLLEFKRFEAGPKGVALEFSDRNKSGNSSAQIPMNTRRGGNQTGNENSANQNAIETSQNIPAIDIEEVPNVPEVEMAE